MNEKIIMLGTGSAMVTDCYNTCFLLKSENDCLLVDAGGGNGILSAIKKSGVAWNSIKTMFITHSHTDHILGAVWVIRQISALMNSGKYDGNFNIYCHDECVDSITAICNHTLAPKFLKNINTKKERSFRIALVFPTILPIYFNNKSPFNNIRGTDISAAPQ